MLQEIIFGFILADSTAVQAKDVVRIILCAENLHREFDIFPFSPDACAFLRNVQRKCVRSDLGAGSSAEGVHRNIPVEYSLVSLFTVQVEIQFLHLPRAVRRRGSRKIFRIRCQPGGKRVSKNSDAHDIREEEERWKPC